MDIFETARLTVRRYRPEDGEQLFRVMSDSRVHTYTKDKNHPWDMDRTKAYIQYMMERDFPTLACFHGAVIEKSTNRLIGLCGLNPYQENAPEIEWKLGAPYWNKGYATELGARMLREAFAAGVLGVYGMAQPENIASRSVLEKLGMTFLGIRFFHGREHAFYYISNENPDLNDK